MEILIYLSMSMYIYMVKISIILFNFYFLGQIGVLRRKSGKERYVIGTNL